MRSIDNEVIDTIIYEYAVATYVFAHCVIWPHRRISEGRMQLTIDRIYTYLKTWEDPHEGREVLYKYILLVVVNEKQWINRAPQPYLMLLDDERNAYWRMMKLKFLKRLHREVKKANSVAAMYSFYHLDYMYGGGQAAVANCVSDLCSFGNRYWAMRFARAIEAQKKIFGELTIKEMVEHFANREEIADAALAA